MGASERRRTQEAQLGIAGMRCGACADRIRDALIQVGGVLRAEVRYASSSARVRFDPARIGVEDLLEAVRVAGERSRARFRAIPIRSRFASGVAL